MFRLLPSEYVTQNEIDAAALIGPGEVNIQQQQRIRWPDASVVARAYLDQLTRSRAIGDSRARSVRAALDRADGLQTGQEPAAAAILDQLDGLAAQLDRDARSASSVDRARLQSLSSTLKGRAARLRTRS